MPIRHVVVSTYLIYTRDVSGVCSYDQTERESGENPELPRSGNQERKLHTEHWSNDRLGSWSQ